jgi:hypothetical protein
MPQQISRLVKEALGHRKTIHEMKRQLKMLAETLDSLEHNIESISRGGERK